MSSRRASKFLEGAPLFLAGAPPFLVALILGVGRRTCTSATFCLSTGSTARTTPTTCARAPFSFLSFFLSFLLLFFVLSFLSLSFFVRSFVFSVVFSLFSRSVLFPLPLSSSSLTRASGEEGYCVQRAQKQRRRRSRSRDGSRSRSRSRSSRGRQGDG